MTTDPVTGKRDGMGARIPAGLEPKIFTFDTGSEYWDKGRLGALRHASMDGTADLPDAPNVRVYYVAGSRHGSGNGAARATAADSSRTTRSTTTGPSAALMAALDAWVREGKEPPAEPASAIRGRDDGARTTSSKFPAVPGVQWPTNVPARRQLKLCTTYVEPSYGSSKAARESAPPPSGGPRRGRVGRMFAAALRRLS